MNYDIEKLLDVFTIFSQNKQKLDKLRIAKLLYFIDKAHLRKYGRVVLGDRYYHMKRGPAPSQTLDLLNELLDDEFEYSVVDSKINKDILSIYLEVNDQYGFKLKKMSDFGALSISEKEVIGEVLKEYGSLRTWQLIDIAHEDATCKRTKKNKEIDYYLFLEGLPEEERELIKGLIKIDTENQRYVDKLENGCYT
ncbi:MAG: Panacea domain-containing protein [Actinomycetota bacterium]|nr:Panacea domain-containing protein [Actinomycetota bacterium]